MWSPQYVFKCLIGRWKLWCLSSCESQDSRTLFFFNLREEKQQQNWNHQVHFSGPNPENRSDSSFLRKEIQGKKKNFKKKIRSELLLKNCLNCLPSLQGGQMFFSGVGGGSFEAVSNLAWSPAAEHTILGCERKNSSCKPDRLSSLCYYLTWKFKD